MSRLYGPFGVHSMALFSHFASVYVDVRVPAFMRFGRFSQLYSLGSLPPDVAPALSSDDSAVWPPVETGCAECAPIV